MATQKQIDANRRNAQLSTGPRSVEGKAASSRNALKTGIHSQKMIIPGEDPAELEALTAEYYDEYQPATPGERSLVDTLITTEWRLARLRHCESEFWLMDSSPARAHSLRAAFFNSDPNLPRLNRMIAAVERTQDRALRTLEYLQHTREKIAQPELRDFSSEPQPLIPQRIPPQPALAPQTTPAIKNEPNSSSPDPQPAAPGPASDLSVPHPEPSH